VKIDFIKILDLVWRELQNSLLKSFELKKKQIDNINEVVLKRYMNNILIMDYCRELF
jgi:hypothetical protein